MAQILTITAEFDCSPFNEIADNGKDADYHKLLKDEAHDPLSEIVNRSA